jgi:hypothetical protein
VDPSSDGTVRKTEIQYLLAADWTGWKHLFANLQFLHGSILDHESEIVQRKNRFFTSLLLRFDFRKSTLFPQLYVLYGIDERESMIRPSLEWKATDRWSIVAGADLFTGPARGILGQFANELPCIEIPENLPDAAALGPCQPPRGPGRPNRLFLRVRYSFDFAFAGPSAARR